MKQFDLFSGYGGFTLALHKAYADVKSVPRIQQGLNSGDRNMSTFNEELLALESLTIGFSEIDKYASAVLKHHWPNIKNYGDISKINWSEVPDFDLLTGGSPCQDLSIAGKRAGLDGARSGLFYEYMRAVREKKPKFFIWENVKGALSSNKGFDFALVLNEMAEAGYSLWWQVLNAKDFGVPQNRERIFVIGFRDGSPREVFFERGTESNSIKVYGELNSESWSKRNESIRRVHNPEGLAPTTPTAQGGGVMTKIIDKKGNIKNKDHASTLTGGGHSGGNHSDMDLLATDRIRRLTPVECERLMGLPDGWTEFGNMFGARGIGTSKDKMSDSQRYKMCGNGVVVNVVEELIKQIILWKE